MKALVVDPASSDGAACSHYLLWFNRSSLTISEEIISKGVLKSELDTHTSMHRYGTKVWRTRPTCLLWD